MNGTGIKTENLLSDNPAYYLRYCKTFNRMGGEMHYLSADNRDFLSELYHVLSEEDTA